MNLDKLLANLTRGRRTALSRTPRRTTRPKGEGAGYIDLIRSLFRR
jgi:hypothetical protein